MRYAWSVRLLAIAGLLSGFEVALPFFQSSFPVPDSVFGLLSLITIAAAFVARLVFQKTFEEDRD